MNNQTNIVFEKTDEYLKGIKTSKEIFKEINEIEGFESLEDGYHLISEMFKFVQLSVFDSIELEDKFQGANREGVVKLIENYQHEKLSGIELELWSDANECWTIVKNEKEDEFVQHLVDEFGFGEIHLKELFTEEVMEQLKIMLKRKESPKIEDFKLTTVFKHHKRRLANALKELKENDDFNQLDSYIEERTELKRDSKIIEELIRNATSKIENNIKLIDKIIVDYVNGEWKASS